MRMFSDSILCCNDISGFIKTSLYCLLNGNLFLADKISSRLAFVLHVTMITPDLRNFVSLHSIVNGPILDIFSPLVNNAATFDFRFSFYPSRRLRTITFLDISAEVGLDLFSWTDLEISSSLSSTSFKSLRSVSTVEFTSTDFSNFTVNSLNLSNQLINQSYQIWLAENTIKGISKGIGLHKIKF